MANSEASLLARSCVEYDPCHPFRKRLHTTRQEPALVDTSHTSREDGEKGKEIAERPVGKGGIVGAGYGIRTRDIQLGKLEAERVSVNTDGDETAPEESTVTPTVTHSPLLEAIRRLWAVLSEADREAFLAEILERD